jgi:hypothetical protein
LPQKRGRTAPQQTQQTANILLKKMAPTKSGSSLRVAAAPLRTAASMAAPAQAARGSSRKNISVEDVVMWEKATGRVWHRLTPAEKNEETERIRTRFAGH